MPKPWYSIQASADAESTDIDILDAISSYYGVGAQAFLKDFSAIKTPNVRVRINTPGGSVFEALTMFNGMRASGKHITVQVLGVAASAGSYIAMAGDKITMPKNTMMFVHNPVMGMHGNAKELRDGAELLEKMGGQLMSAYERRFKGKPEDLAALFAAESYLTADECLANGLCDEVTDEILIEAKFEVDHLPANVQALLKHRPAATVSTGPAAALPAPTAAVVTPTAPAPAVTTPAADAAPTPQALEALATEHGISDHLVHLVLDTSVTSAATALAAATRIRSVVELCRVVGEPDATAHVSGRKSYDEVRAAITAARAAAADDTHVSSVRRTENPDATVTASTLDLDALWKQIKSNMTRSYTA